MHLLEIGYEPFHRTGDEGVLDEIDEIIHTGPVAFTLATNPHNRPRAVSLYLLISRLICDILSLAQVGRVVLT